MNGLVKLNIKRSLAVISAAATLAGTTAALPASAAEQTAIEYSVGALAAPKITKASKTSDSVTLKWSKVKGATGYKVYKLVGKKYKAVGAVKGAANVKYKIKGLKSGKKYSFKVRAYKKASGKTSWSRYSAAKSVTTKYGLGNGNFSCKKYSLKFNKQIWDAEYYSEDPYRFELYCKKDDSISMVFNYFDSDELMDGDTAETVAKSTVDFMNRREGVHAEISDSGKFGGADACIVHIWGEEGSNMNPDYDMYIAYAVVDNRPASIECQIKNDHYDDCGKIMDNVVKTFKFNKKRR